MEIFENLFFLKKMFGQQKQWIRTMKTQFFCLGMGFEDTIKICPKIYNLFGEYKGVFFGVYIQ